MRAFNALEHEFRLSVGTLMTLGEVAGSGNVGGIGRTATTHRPIGHRIDAIVAGLSWATFAAIECQRTPIRYMVQINCVHLNYDMLEKLLIISTFI